MPPSTPFSLRASTLLIVPVLALTGVGSAADRGGSANDHDALTEAAALVDATPPPPPAPAPASTPAAPEAAEAPTATAKRAAAEAEPAPAKKAAAEAEPAPALKVAPPAEPEAPQPQAPEEAAPAPRPRTLYLAIGHGRNPEGRLDPGAENLATGAFEIDAAAIMVEAMVEVLNDAPGLELTRESGDHVNVIGSVAAANAAGVDDCIEVHQDSAAAPPGAFAHWYPGSGSAQRLADGLIERVRELGVPTRTDWHRARPGLYFLRKSTCRAVLVEIGRVGDFDAEALQALGRGMAEAYLRDTAKARGVAP